MSPGLWALVRAFYSLPRAAGSCGRLSLRRDSFSSVSCLLTGLSCLRAVLFLPAPSSEGRCVVTSSGALWLKEDTALGSLGQPCPRNEGTAMSPAAPCPRWELRSPELRNLILNRTQGSPSSETQVWAWPPYPRPVVRTVSEHVCRAST